MRAGDYPVFAALFPELESGDPTPGEGYFADKIAPQAVVAELDGQVVGYSFFQVFVDEGYIRHLAVDRRVRGRGIGRALMRAIAARMRALGCARWRLNVKPENEPAVGLYRAMGMEVAYASATLRFSWTLVDMITMLPRRLTIARVLEEEYSRIEAHFGLPQGQLALLDRSPTTYLLRLVDADLPDDLTLGFAAFDVAFGGAFPFRVAEPGLAGPLLTGLRPLASPERPTMQIVAEGDPRLAEMLFASGAAVVMRFVHMTGALPAESA
ncbi:MAG: GNAT family N-acetyltransferase [Nannocystaceae bacterium]